MSSSHFFFPMGNTTFRVTNHLGNTELDCEILNFILATNGINSEIITQSNENDSEWLVQISENQKYILEKKEYLLQGLHNNVEYSLHFCPLEKDRLSLSPRSQREELINWLHPFRDTDDQNSAGDLGMQKPESYHLWKPKKFLVPIANLDVDDEQKTVLVRNVPTDLNLKFLEIFLENEKLSGGGKIRNLMRVENSTDVEVTFENVAVIGQVLKKSPLKFNDLTFPIIEKPMVNRARKKLEESKEKIIEVHGVPADMDLGIVKLYFENRRKSGGGKITEDLIRDRITGTVLVTFAFSEDAIRVVKQGEHVFDGRTYEVKVHRGSKGKQFFLSDVKTGLNEDSIINFLESKTNIWVENIVKMEAENMWMVYCKDIVNFSQVQQLCKVHTMKFLSDTYPKVSPVPASDTILVSSLLPGHELSEEMMHLYFQACIHEGQDVKSLRKLNADQFLVTFNDLAVVPEMCQRTHKIMDTELQVIPYFKKMIPYYSMPNDGIYEDYLLDSSFKLELMKKYQMTVETMLQPHVKPIWSKSNGQVLKIGYSRGSSREEALKTLKNLLQNIYEETIRLSPEMFKKAKQLTQKETLNAIISLDTLNQTLQIVAFGENTILQYKDSLMSSGFSTSTESQMIPMDSYKISLLFAKRFPQQMQEKYPGIHIVSGRKEIIIKGNASNFTEVEKEMYKCLSNIQCTSVQLPKYSSFLLRNKQVKSYIIEKVKSKKCIASWETKGYDSIIVYSLQANHLPIVSDIFKSSIKALDFTVRDAKKDFMKLKKWEAFLQSIQKNYANLFYLDVKTLIGVTIDCEEQKIKSEFENFFESNIMLERLVTLEKTQADYLKTKKMKDINDFCQTFGTENPVTMIIRPDNQLCITAPMKNMDKASEFIEDIIKGFKEIKNMIAYFGVENTSENDKKKNKSASAKELQTIFQMKYANQTINIYLGDMTQLPVDAIVNAANKEMEHGGGVAKAIIDKGGLVIQAESKTILTSWNVKSIQVGDAIITSGGNLPCKHVIHAVGPIWTGGNTNERVLLSNAVKKSLEIAEKKSLASIAFPAISAGSYKYPLEKAVDAIISTVKEYLDKNSTTSLKTISFVDTRKMVAEEFQRQIIQVFFQENSDKKKAPSKPVSNSPPGNMPTTTTNTLIIKRGELEKIKAGIIVNSISTDLDFSKGQLASAILRSAGKEMQTECQLYTGLSVFQIIITKGYKLPCDNVFHISLPFCKGDADVIIQKYMEQCLTVADKYKASSIAFPSLGTGQLNYPPEVVAKVMLKAAYYHLSRASTSLKEVLIIIYPKDTNVYKAFQIESNGLQKIPGINIDIENNNSTIEMNIIDSVNAFLENPSKSANTLFEMKNTPNQSSLRLTAQGFLAPAIMSPDFILGAVQIYLINGDLLDAQTDAIVHCTDATFSLKGAISRCLCRKSGGGFINDCQSKTSEMVKHHFAVTNAHYLKCKLILHLDIVSQLSEPEKILETCFSGAEKYNISSLSLPQLATDGRNVPLDQMAAAMVEVLSKLKSRFLKQVNVVLYQSQMVATLKNDILHAQRGTIVPTKMTPSDILKVTPLQKSDAEYQKVQKEFLSSLKRNASIISIEKIYNKPLKIQYEAQLEKIKALNPPQTKNEHILWHGTKKDTVMKISKDGFDRGYCGVNGTWHGKGVYFAIYSEYSDQDMYSPRDSKGYKHMLMCRVATGVYVQGTREMTVLPTKPNSSQKYDSAVNNPKAPTVFIIFNDVQAYPTYHITYL